ncbi:hypothetical protein V1478_004052 [Vespula squamosa]|uniref:Uncharacterized protein n=1 Tax=Vespula squamosa TaxID=30214 RepID=A0ABD2BP50_VESSQ
MEGYLQDGSCEEERGRGMQGLIDTSAYSWRSLANDGDDDDDYDYYYDHYDDDNDDDDDDDDDDEDAAT